MLDALLLVMEAVALLAAMRAVVTPCAITLEPVRVNPLLERTPLRWTSGFL
jgi:hypothetical protein